MWQVEGSVTTSTATTVTYGGPCRECGHEQDRHGVVCETAECPDDDPMCMGCIEDYPATDPFHRYESTPVWVHLA